jgi:predicted HicB family RNase H-like nuclease
VLDKVQFNVMMDPETAKLARLAAIGENMRLADWLDEAIRKRAGRPIKAPPVRSGE